MWPLRSSRSTVSISRGAISSGSPFPTKRMRTRSKRSGNRYRSPSSPISISTTSSPLSQPRASTVSALTPETSGRKTGSKRSSRHALNATFRSGSGSMRGAWRKSSNSATAQRRRGWSLRPSTTSSFSKTSDSPTSRSLSRPATSSARSRRTVCCAPETITRFIWG